MINESIKAEKQLREAEQNFLNFFQQNPLTMVLSSIEDGTLLDTALRESWDEMGIESEDVTILGKSDTFLTNTNYMVTPYIGYYSYPYDYVVDKDEREHMKSILMSGGEVSGLPISLCRADGVWRETLFYTKVISYRGKKCLFTTGQDITERKRAEEALRKSEERFRNVYSTAPLTFVVWDIDTRITDWNKKSEEVFGWLKEEVVGRTFFDLIIPEKDRPHVKEVVNSLINGGLPSYSINDNLTKDGQIITCEWSNSLLHDDDGNIMGAIS